MIHFLLGRLGPFSGTFAKHDDAGPTISPPGTHLITFFVDLGSLNGSFLDATFFGTFQYVL